jgi:capsular polysaccharide transport system permease protein
MKRDNDATLLREVSATVQDSRLNSIKSKYYLEIISPTSKPTAPERPQRFEWIAGILFGSLLLWSLVR